MNGRPDHEYRRAIDISVVNPHGGVEEPDHVMHDRHHRLAGRLGIAVGDLYGDLLVLTQQHRRIIAAVVDQRVVQAAIARARIERNIRKTELLDEVDDDIRLPASFGVWAPGVRFVCTFFCIRRDFVHFQSFTLASSSRT
jgi:hypothetical protein